MGKSLDPITLEVLWTRMITIANEIGTTLARTAFSTVLREGLDYSAGIFDAKGNMLAQGNAAATGHIGSMPYVVKSYLQALPPDKLEPGDIIITNDPWIGAGHTNDVYIAAPIFKGWQFIGMVVTSAHQLDIGGRLASTESREVYEEGLRIPVLKLFKAGRPNEELFKIIHENVRMADKVVGDIRAEIAAAHDGVNQVLEVIGEYGLQDLEGLGKEIIRHTDIGMRESVKMVPDGVYQSKMDLEETDSRGKPLHIKLTIAVRGDELVADYDGTSPQVDKPINCVLNYTRAYTVLGVKLAINPGLPNNEGTYRAIRVRAPEGSLLNCRFPAAVHWRHVMGLRMPELVFQALAPAIPRNVPAGSGGEPVWLYTLTGVRRNGQRFLLASHAMGGLGAGYSKDGMSCVSFPANPRDIPAEIMENETPVLVEKREFVCDSAGAGKYRGGLGEEMVFRNMPDGDVPPDKPIIIPLFPGRLCYPAPGLMGGMNSPQGQVLINGVPSQDISGQEIALNAGEYLVLRVPGGAGYHSPIERDPAAVEDDVHKGFVSIEQAERVYGVVIDRQTLKVDVEATRRCREALARA